MCISYEREHFVKEIRDLKEKNVLRLAERRLGAGEDPLFVIEDCQKGMRIVGELYGQGKYYISGLIMAGEIFQQVMLMAQPALKENAFQQSQGCVLLGTVQEDIHDLGKNIFHFLLTCNGFTVHDLGVDVAPRLFAEKAMQVLPDVIGLSGLVTASYKNMKDTIALIRQEYDDQGKVPVIIGGGQVNRQVARLVGTDYWSNDATEGVRLCRRLVPN